MFEAAAVASFKRHDERKTYDDCTTHLLLNGLHDVLLWVSNGDEYVAKRSAFWRGARARRAAKGTGRESREGGLIGVGDRTRRGRENSGAFNTAVVLGGERGRVWSRRGHATVAVGTTSAHPWDECLVLFSKMFLFQLHRISLIVHFGRWAVFRYA